MLSGKLKTVFADNTIQELLINPSALWLAFENAFTVTLAIAIKLIKYWNQNQKEKLEMEQENLRSELELLKKQINPHFLFNTLNNINTLVFIDQQKTYETILKLSELLRYMIYETKAEKVLLKDEVEYIINYVELQRIRYKDQQFISLEIEGLVGNQLIAPMLFIPFVENAFKYSSKRAPQNPGISIKFYLTTDIVQFEVRNYTQKNTKSSVNGGIGIENTLKRLELIYPGLHKISIKDEESFFVVALEIKLKNSKTT